MKLCALTLSIAVATAVGPAVGQVSGTLDFENVTDARVVMTVPEAAGPHMKSLAAGDYDRDGDLDVAIAIAAGTFGSRTNKLYRNDSGVLVEISGSPVLPEFCCADVSRVAEYRDFDGDSWLDLVVVNDAYEFQDPVLYFRGTHSGGVFTGFVEEGAARGLGLDWACGAAAADFDGDGDQDLYTGNYGGGMGQDVLYRNDGTGNFTEITPTHLPSDTDFTIDVAVADVNGDGKLDVLVSNESAPFYIYYNDLLGQGSEQGDFRYGGGGGLGRQSLGPSVGHGALEPADFDGDGRVDVYWTNMLNGSEDMILANQGNGADGKALFAQVQVPAYPRGASSVKATIADLDRDGRPDVIVMTGGRPAILRNTSVPGAISFVDWTPAPAFPADALLAGAHAIALDSDGGGELDLLLGGTTGDHLFDAVPATTVLETDLGGALPALMNESPVALAGTLAPGPADELSAADLGSEGYLALILRGDDDLRLDVLRDGVPVATSDRPGLGTVEALQVDTDTPGAWSVRVTSNVTAGTGGRYVLELLARSDLPTGGGNDDCVDAEVVSTGTYAFSNIGATTDGPSNPPCYLFGDDQVQSDVWFDFLAPCTGTWTVSTCSSADFDTKIALYEGAHCPVDGFRLLACEEDTAGCDNFTTTISAPVLGGEWYKIRVGGYLGEQGSGTLTVSCENEPGVVTYCIAEPNSATDGSRLSAAGSRAVGANSLVLTAIDLPPDQTGYFLTSATQTFIPGLGGGQGNLCVGAPQFRFSQSVLDSGSEGQAGFALDHANLPAGLTIAPGETWNFQLWYRDMNPGPTSNTSDGLAITFL